MKTREEVKREFNAYRRRVLRVMPGAPIATMARYGQVRQADVARHEAAHAIVALAVGAELLCVAVGRSAFGWEGAAVVGTPPYTLGIAITFAAGAVGDGSGILSASDADIVCTVAHSVGVPARTLLDQALKAAARVLKSHRRAHDALTAVLVREGVPIVLDRREIFRVVREVEPSLCRRRLSGSVAAYWRGARREMLARLRETLNEAEYRCAACKAPSGNDDGAPTACCGALHERATRMRRGTHGQQL